MGHCISIFVMRKSELRTDKINSVISDEISDDIKWTELNSDFIATTYIPNIKEFGKDKSIVYLTTDYFGGHGNQSAKVFINNKKVFNQNDEFDWKLKPINSALKMIGVNRIESMDEFDTIGLGKFRSNADFQ